MLLKATINYSPNFNIKKRSKKSIKFLIFHYTGMKREQEAIQRLTNIQSEVANGNILFVSPIFVLPDILTCEWISTFSPISTLGPITV